MQRLLFLNGLEQIFLSTDGLLCWGAVVTQIRALKAGVGGLLQSNSRAGMGGGIIIAKSKFFGLEVLETMEPLVFSSHSTY